MKIKEKMVSVLIPVYNRQRVLNECVQSVLKQSYQNFEILLIDDGSTDKTLEVCETLCSLDTRVRLFKSEHLGVSGARNIGLEAAEGEYIFFLDSDDIIHPHSLEALVNRMKQSGALISGIKCLACLEEHWETVREKIFSDSSSYETTYYNHEETLKAVFEGKSPLSMIGGTMMKKSLIGDTRFATDLFIGEDFYFIYQNLIKNADAVFLKQPWYLNRIHKENTSWQYDFDAFWTRFYRRVLVWKSEESFGRTQYANIQKNSAFGCFGRCICQNKIYSKDAKKMRKILREYKKEILPAFSLKLRLRYIISAYFPLTNFCLYKISGNKLLRKIMHKSC